MKIPFVVRSVGPKLSFLRGAHQQSPSKVYNIRTSWSIQHDSMGTVCRQEWPRLTPQTAALLVGGWRCSGIRILNTYSTVTTMAFTSLPLSPAVRYLVDSNSLDPSLIPASGPHTRLLKGDVLKYLESAKTTKSSSNSKPIKSPTSPHATLQQPVGEKLHTLSERQAGFTDVPVDIKQRDFAITAVQSKMSLPHTYTSIQCYLGPLLSSIQHTQEQGKIILDSYFIKAAAATLKQIPHSNAVWNEDGLQCLTSINIAIGQGRLGSTPVLKGVDRMSVENITSLLETEDLLQDEPAALMLSSLSSSPLIHYMAVVQSPHSAVLSIAGIQREHSEDISTTSFTACLSSDSRVLNSDLASQWLSQFKTNVEMFRML